jgi:hypothetical protein
MAIPDHIRMNIGDMSQILSRQREGVNGVRGGDFEEVFEMKH